ncbi:MAG TPA: tripartite tricarboxylate transporter substrate binding protein [Burkholderiales bacterium]|jgi:tripartite-type tricarboxylate transporter receptor subunit TctC|nr:tripartite tricarboxylate transporter substrate binding protein [Burkholderiales bacterium]
MRCLIRKAGLALGLLAVSAAVLAQGYPQKTIRFVVPFPPGGATDALARILGERMSDAWKQPVLIDNRAGAGGNIAAEIVAKSPADGYTIIIVGMSHAANLALYSKLAYHPVRDFAPVTQAVAMNMFLVVHPSLPVKSVKELIALAKTKPGALNYGSGGSGSTPHMAMELFKSLAGVDLVHVPYKGTQSVIGIMRGEAAMLFENLISVGAHVQSGKLRALAVGATKRSGAMPELPTVAEAGVPGYEMAAWFGVLAPAGTPRPVIAALQREMAGTLKQPEVRERFAKLGAEPVGSTPEEFDALIKSEIAKWGKVVKEAGLKAD